MGIYDRDYYRTPPRTPIMRPHLRSVTTWLILTLLGYILIRHDSALNLVVKRRHRN